jgi:hypothetical protein
MIGRMEQYSRGSRRELQPTAGKGIGPGAGTNDETAEPFDVQQAHAAAHVIEAILTHVAPALGWR